MQSIDRSMLSATKYLRPLAATSTCCGVPASTSLTGSNLELERLAAVPRAVKLVAIRECASVVHRDLQVAGSQESDRAC